MARYINADYVKRLILNVGLYCDTQEDKKYSASIIDTIPTADVVERKKGENYDEFELWRSGNL